MDLSSLGDLVARERKRLNLSQEQLAKMAGVSREWISKIETKRGDQLSFDKLKRLAQALELPPTTLLSRGGYSVEPTPVPATRSMVSILRQALAIAEKLESDSDNDTDKNRYGSTQKRTTAGIGARSYSFVR